MNLLEVVLALLELELTVLLAAAIQHTVPKQQNSDSRELRARQAGIGMAPGADASSRLRTSHLLELSTAVPTLASF